MTVTVQHHVWTHQQVLKSILNTFSDFRTSTVGRRGVRVFKIITLIVLIIGFSPQGLK